MFFVKGRVKKSIILISVTWETVSVYGLKETSGPEPNNIYFMRIGMQRVFSISAISLIHLSLEVSSLKSWFLTLMFLRTIEESLIFLWNAFQVHGSRIKFKKCWPFWQWRNSYGLRVGKPAGTRAEGAPAGCPFTLVFQLRLPFQKGAPFQHFFHSLVAKFP